MMKKIRLLFLAILFIFSACSTSQLITDADQSLQRGEYYNAIEKYKIANGKEKDPDKKAIIALGMANSYWGMGAYSQSATWYKNAIRRGQDEIKNQIHLADALRAKESLQDANELYSELKAKNPENIQAQNGINSLKLIEQWGKLPPIYLIENLKSPNSSGNEISPCIVPGQKNVLLYSSSNENSKGKAISPVTGFKYADFFISEYDSTKEKWMFPKPADEIISFNTENHESGITISSDNQLLVFSRAIPQDDKKLCNKLYMSVKWNKKWSIPTLISFSDDGANYFDPSISADGRYLLFASDRKGSIGQSDIWKSIINDGKFSQPENLGDSINTPGKERSPFMKKNGHLYFASDFHPGAGGLDIFHATADLNGKWTVENMSTPINSPDDDFGIVYFNKGEKGYFSSSRKGSRSVDIYSFYSPPRLFQCHGKVCNRETDSIIANVNVRIVGTDGTNLLLRTKEGEFNTELKPEADYAIMVFKKGYLNAQAKISTKGMREAVDFNLNFEQTPTDKPIKIDNINYESGKWSLLPSSKKSLDELIGILAINPEIKIEIMSHTDDVGEPEFNMELSQKRAEEVVNYLIQKGVNPSRLKAKGYGESLPLKLSRKLSEKYNFMKEGDVLNTKFIQQFSDLKKIDAARALNRRTEFQVLNP